MKTKRNIMIAGVLLALGTGTAAAQEKVLSSYQYVEVQGGIETALNKNFGGHMDSHSQLLSPAFALSYGYMGTTIGGRLHFSGYKAKGEYEAVKFKWDYLDVNADLLLNVTSLITDKYDRSVNMFLLGGFGVVNTWKKSDQLPNTKQKVYHNFRLGMRFESNVTKPFGVSLELSANSNSDPYFGNLSGNKDWALSAMLGISYRFGKKYETVQRPAPVVEEAKLTYYQMMTNELNEKLELWSKQMPNETLEAYQLRVNDQTRAEKKRMLTYEISTRMANDLLNAPGTTVGNYYPAKEKLAIHLQSMPDIYLDIPSKDATTFYNTKQLALKNAKYKINPDDSFEVVYAEVNNPSTNQVYVFDNMAETSLAAIKNDPNSIPLDILYRTKMEETKLQAIKDDMTNLAYQKQLISDKTHISVETNVLPESTPNGKIINYDVKMTYEVEQKYSARDDFKPGHYLIEESGAAMAMLSIMDKAFKEDFAKYCVNGKRVLFKITGTADASPIKKPIAYNGQYGEHRGTKVNKNGVPGTIDLTTQEGIKDNEQLSFARALGVKNYIETKQTAFKQMKRDYEYNVEVSNEKGSQYRRISVECLFVDAF